MRRTSHHTVSPWAGRATAATSSRSSGTVKALDDLAAHHCDLRGDGPPGLPEALAQVRGLTFALCARATPDPGRAVAGDDPAALAPSVAAAFDRLGLLAPAP
ncbi:hypothetical protein [Nonomuraea sp. NPDC052265]|uniref:hypothetical protein n=1 Tax=Nonomuraea sp. NPDC052265 TaxID=3364374 RepID=UPI0037C6FF84